MHHLKNIAAIVLSTSLLVGGSFTALADELGRHWVQAPLTKEWVLLDSNNNKQTGWQLVDNKWYHMGIEGFMDTGWYNEGTDWYYLDPVNGNMTTGWQLVNNQWYLMDASGKMLKGWQCVNNHWYYLTDSGAMATNWQNVNGKWYYFGGDGIMQTNIITPDGYYIGADGVWYGSSDTQSNSYEEKDTSSGDANTLVSNISLDEMRALQLERINKERKAAGRSTLELDDDLNEVAQIRAEEITEYFDHDRPDGSDCFTLYEDYGFDSYRGENIAMGYRTVTAVMDGWMNSQGHKDNILNKNFKRVGLGLAQGPDTYWYWAQAFSN